MTKFEQCFMKRIIAREVRQGFAHQQRITALYRMIYMACEREFYEDNVHTMNANLTEWFNNSLRKSAK